MGQHVGVKPGCLQQSALSRAFPIAYSGEYDRSVSPESVLALDDSGRCAEEERLSRMAQMKCVRFLQL